MEPAKHWLIWLKFIVILAILLGLAALAGVLRESKSEWAAAIVITAAIFLLIVSRPVKQRIDITCEGESISLMLTINMLGRVDMHTRTHTDAKLKRVKLGSCSPFKVLPLSASAWFEHTLDILGRPQRLLVYFRFPNGFTVGLPGNAPYKFTRNEFCF